MNLKTQEQKDLEISHCSFIHSFEDKVLVQILDQKKIQKLFQFTKGELQLLDEKSVSEQFTGNGNLGILSSMSNKLLNFFSGKIVITKNKIEYRSEFYNSLVGPTKYPEFAEEIC